MSVTTDLYHQLFGKNHIQDGDVISFSEHGRVGGVSTGQGFKAVSVVDPNSGTALTSLIETLQELSSRLAAISGAVANTAQLRAVVTGVVTASGPITSAQSIAEKNAAGVSYTTRVATEGINAALMNINNVVITV